MNAWRYKYRQYRCTILYMSCVCVSGCAFVFTKSRSSHRTRTLEGFVSLAHTFLAKRIHDDTARAGYLNYCLNQLWFTHVFFRPYSLKESFWDIK